VDREDIRDYTRILADELDAAPEGVFEDSELDILINIAYQNVYMELCDKIPHKFRKKVLINLVAGQEEYEVAETTGDIDAGDVMAVEVIVRNIAGKRTWPLIEITPEMTHQFMEKPDYTDTYPSAWRWEENNVIAFSPIPSASLASALKMYYYPELEDMDDDADIPEIPKLAHPLIAIDVLRQWGIRTAEGQAAVEARWAETLERVLYKLSIKSALRGGQLPSTIEMSGYGEDIVES